MEEFNNMAGNITSFARNVNCLLPSWKICTGHLKGLGKFCETINTTKERFLSKKGPKEGKRGA